MRSVVFCCCSRDRKESQFSRNRNRCSSDNLRYKLTLKASYYLSSELVSDPGPPPYPNSCGGTYQARSDNRKFASPEYPVRYPPESYCSWTIMANPGYVVLLSFEDFQLEENCAYDNVKVYDEAPRK